jgi:hypothetical protein
VLTVCHIPHSLCSTRRRRMNYSDPTLILH